MSGRRSGKRGILLRLLCSCTGYFDLKSFLRRVVSLSSFLCFACCLLFACSFGPCGSGFEGRRCGIVVLRLFGGLYGDGNVTS